MKFTKCETHISSVALFSVALDSDSQLEWETVGCFFALQETKLPPKKIE